MCSSCADKNEYTTSERGSLPAGNGNRHFNDEKFIAVISLSLVAVTRSSYSNCSLTMTKRISNDLLHGAGRVHKQNCQSEFGSSPGYT